LVDGLPVGATGGAACVSERGIGAGLQDAEDKGEHRAYQVERPCRVGCERVGEPAARAAGWRAG